MSSQSSENDLEERHYVTLIVRSLVDSHGRLIHGEMVDASNTYREPFMGGPGLISAVQSWLAWQEGGDGSPQTSE